MLIEPLNVIKALALTGEIYYQGFTLAGEIHVTPFYEPRVFGVMKSAYLPKESLGKPLGLIIVGVAATFEAFSRLR